MALLGLNANQVTLTIETMELVRKQNERAMRLRGLTNVFVNQLLPVLIGGLDRVSASPARHHRPRVGTFIPTSLRRRTWGNRRSGRVRPTSLKPVRFIPHRKEGKRSNAGCLP